MYRSLRGEGTPEKLVQGMEDIAAQLGWDNLAEFFVSQTLQALYPPFNSAASAAGEPAPIVKHRLVSRHRELGRGWNVNDHLPESSRPARAEYVSFVKQLTAFWKAKGRI